MVKWNLYLSLWRSAGYVTGYGPPLLPISSHHQELLRCYPSADKLLHIFQKLLSCSASNSGFCYSACQDQVLQVIWCHCMTLERKLLLPINARSYLLTPINSTVLNVALLNFMVGSMCRFWMRGTYNCMCTHLHCAYCRPLNNLMFFGYGSPSVFLLYIRVLSSSTGGVAQTTVLNVAHFNSMEDSRCRPWKLQLYNWLSSS